MVLHFIVSFPLSSPPFLPLLKCVFSVSSLRGLVASRLHSWVPLVPAYPGSAHFGPAEESRDVSDRDVAG